MTDLPLNWEGRLCLICRTRKIRKPGLFMPIRMVTPCSAERFLRIADKNLIGGIKALADIPSHGILMASTVQAFMSDTRHKHFEFVLEMIV